MYLSRAGVSERDRGGGTRGLQGGLPQSLGICIRKQLSRGLIFYVCCLLQRSVSCMLNSKEQRVVATALTRRCTAGEKNTGRTLSAGKYGENENELSRNLRIPPCNLGGEKPTGIFA